ncbi:MAG: glycosyltransferase family 2 protein [Desulfobacterales bacterium]|nr:glycosyltransferase family 2 protein [Desulfobacterales bacterium]
MRKLSIIIPAYNEQDRIVGTLANTLNYLKCQNFDSEVIVVSDGSEDHTKDVVLKFRGNKKISVRVLEYHPNRGKGFAVRYGILRAGGDLLLFMDADYSVPIEEIEKGIVLIDDGYDIAMGSRTASESTLTCHQSRIRELSARCYTFIQNCYLGINYNDTQCGFKLFKIQAAKELFGKQKLDSVIFDAEILWLAKQSGYKVAEFPVQWTHAPDSRIRYDNLGKCIFVFQELFKIRKIHGKAG